MTEARRTASPQDIEFLSKVAAFWKSKAQRSNAPSQFGRFVIKERLGEGGFGVVFLAHDPLIGRDVAIKLPGIESLSDESRLKRFLAEAKHLGAIAGNNIAEIYEANEIDGLCYLAMKYYPDGTLAQWLAAQPTPLSIDIVTSIFAGIVNGVASAHSASIIHRDLKPSNILIERASSSDSSQTGITPFVADFGLAKSYAADSQPCSNTIHSRLGTVGYVAPEQWINGLPSTLASDVFALGAILFELLAGRPPKLYGPASPDSAGDSVNQRTPEQALRLEVTNLCKIRQDTASTLLRIVEKCLQFDPAERYRDANELLADLRDVGAGSFTSRRQSIRPASRQAIVRNALFAFLAIVLLAIASVWLTQPRATTVENYILANSLEEQRAYALEIQTAFERSKSDSTAVRQQAVRRALSRLKTRSVPFEAAYLSSLDDSSREFALNLGTSHWIPNAVVSNDRKWLAVPGPMQDILLFSLELSHSVRRYRGLQDNFFRVAVSPGNNYVVGVTSIYQRPDRTAPQVLVWDFETSKLLFDLNDHTDLVNLATCEFLSDDHLLISGSFREGDLVKVCSIGKRSVEQSNVTTSANLPSPLALERHEENFRFQVCETIGPSIDSPKLVVVDKLEQRTSIFHLKHDAVALDLSNKGLIAIVDSFVDPSNIDDPQSARIDQEVVVWDPQSEIELFREVRKEATPITAIAFSPDEKYIFTMDALGIVHQRGLQQQSLENSSEGLAPEETWCVSIHPAEPKVLYCGDSGWVGLHSLQASRVTQANNQPLSCMRWHLHGDMLVTQCAWRPGHTDQFATSSFDGNVRLWQLTSDTPQMLAEFPHPGRVRCIAFTADGARIATGGEDQLIRVFDINSREPVATLAEHTGKVRSLAYTSDSRTLFSSANDAAIIAWDLSTEKSSNTEHLSANPICSAISPNGKWFVFGTEAGVLGVRLLAGDGESKDIPVSKQWLRCVAISSDSQTLATGTQDGEIALWNLETGIKLAEFSKQPSPIMSLSFSADNRTLTAGLYSGQLVFWNALADLPENTRLLRD